MGSELRTIVDGLNGEPFKMNLNLISFDMIYNEQLLQILSDVLFWIEDLDTIDIREEGPDETALRIFNSLRILKYPPPTDIEKLQRWRRGIVEGEKVVIYPILEWIFKNVILLKERAYLAKYLTKIDVPGAFQDPEVMEMSNQISALMEEFKASLIFSTLSHETYKYGWMKKDVHSQVVEARKDSLVMEDIRTDLNTMKVEKEQLSKRIDKIERKLRGITNIEHFLRVAEKCRLENERLEKVGHLKLEQRNLMLFSDQKIQRLNASLKELKAAGENVDPTERMKTLKEEMETNYYMVNEKLPKEIETKMTIIANLSKVVDVSVIDKNDIDELQQKIEKMNQEIMNLVNERDRKDEITDKLSIYRHQASAVQRKKEKLVEMLQEARSELQTITNKVEEKRSDLREKSGTDLVITATQFKNYVNKLRSKTSNYKRKHAELGDLKSEHVVLMHTADILTNQWNTMKQKIEAGGGGIIEGHAKRSGTSEPKIVDIRKLRDLINKSNQQLHLRRTAMKALRQSNAELNNRLTDVMERLNLKKENYESAEANLESVFAQLQQNVSDMENELLTKNRKMIRAGIELKVLRAILEKLRQERSMGGLKMFSQIEKEISCANKKVEALQHLNHGSEFSLKEAATQMAMWRSLVKIFQLKLQIAEAVNNDRT
uniref:Intraflagellar transport protein 81 homolog n=1 Tax=Setaria digitata TaxID=48799 RepID=A0A915PU49_9BILA